MLGETYELVTDRIKFVTEKIQHIPTPMIAQYLEGPSYVSHMYVKAKPAFKLNGGKGMLEIG